MKNNQKILTVIGILAIIGTLLISVCAEEKIENKTSKENILLTDELPNPPQDQGLNPLWYVRHSRGEYVTTLTTEDQKMLIESGVDYVVFSGYMGDPIVESFNELIAQSGSNMKIGRTTIGISIIGGEDDPEWEPYLLHCACHGEPVHMGGGTIGYAFDPNRTVDGVSFTEKFTEKLLNDISGLHYDAFAEFDYVYMHQSQHFDNDSTCSKRWFDEYETNGQADDNRWREAVDAHLATVKEALASRPEGPVKLVTNNALSIPSIEHLLNKRLNITDGIYHQWLGLGDNFLEPPKRYDPEFMEGVLDMVDEVVARRKLAFLECNAGHPSVPEYNYTSPTPPTESNVTYGVGVFHLVRNDTYTYFAFGPAITELSLQMVEDWKHIVNGNYGEPLGPRKSLGNHVWEREFTNGKWIVDLSNYTARFERNQQLVVTLTADPTSIISGNDVTITVYVTNSSVLIADANVTLQTDNDGTFSPSSGKTDSNGYFTSLFTAPEVDESVVVNITALAEKFGYFNDTDNVEVTVEPSPKALWIEVSCDPDTIFSAESTNVTVNVTNMGVGVEGASILTSDNDIGGSFGTVVDVGIGNYFVIYDAPHRALTTDITLNITVSKTGYINGGGSTSLLVYPKPMVSLFDPSNGEQIDDINVTLEWYLVNSNNFSESEVILYDVYLSYQTPIPVKTADSLQEIEYILYNLTKGTYYWKVIPTIAGLEGTCISGTWNFTVTIEDSPDEDGDGMPDSWESIYGLDTERDDSAEDRDIDGLTNLEEYLNGTIPTNNDSDGDGMPDGWEVEYGLNPLINDANDDNDNDGYTNLEEYVRGTSPLDPEKNVDGTTEDRMDIYIILIGVAIAIIGVLLTIYVIRKRKSGDQKDSPDVIRDREID